jgi:hypothetical protein
MQISSGRSSRRSALGIYRAIGPCSLAHTKNSRTPLTWQGYTRRVSGLANPVQRALITESQKLGGTTYSPYETGLTVFRLRRCLPGLCHAGSSRFKTSYAHDSEVR